MTGVSSSCGACKFLRRRCTNECIFAPYFCYEQASTHFAAVHKVFGASNVSKLLLHLPVHARSDAAITISYEALARMQDLIYGCVAHIYALQQQVASLEEEIEIIENQMASTMGVDIPIPYYATSDPYLATQFDSINEEQQSLPVLQSGNTCLNQISCSRNPAHITDQDEISEFSFFEDLIEELNQENYQFQELSQDYYCLHSSWMKNAAP